MNSFDKILASGFYAYNGNLNSHMVRMFITLARKSGVSFSRKDLVMDGIKEYMEFDSPMYKLKNGYTMTDIAEFLDIDIIRIFYLLEKSRDRYYSMENKKSPTFDEAIKKIMIYDQSKSNQKTKRD